MIKEPKTLHQVCIVIIVSKTGVEAKSTAVGKIIQKIKNEVNYKTVIEGCTAISTKLRRP